MAKYKTTKVLDHRKDQKRKLEKLLGKGWVVESCHPHGMFLGQAKGMTYNLRKD